MNKTGEIIMSWLLVGLLILIVILTVISMGKDNLVTMIGLGILVSMFRIKSV